MLNIPTSTEQESSKSRPAVWVSAILIVLVLCFAIGEVAARLAHVQVFQVAPIAKYLGWAQQDPVLGWRHNPGVHRSHEGSHEPMTILPDGSRATGPAPESGKTVAFVGCSFTEGYGVRDEETFAWRLQQNFPQYRIRDYGTAGYGTYQSLMLLRELITRDGLRPALVVYGFLPQHAMRNTLTYQVLEAFRAFGGQRFSPPHVALKDGQLQAFPPFSVANWPLEEHSALVTLLHQTELRARLSARERDQEQVTQLLLLDMKKLVEQNGGHFLVATLDMGGPPGPEATRRMIDRMQQSGIEELDITYHGPETRPEKLLVGGNGHPGPLIHAWWADMLGTWIKSHPVESGSTKSVSTK